MDSAMGNDALIVCWVGECLGRAEREKTPREGELVLLVTLECGLDFSHVLRKSIDHIFHKEESALLIFLSNLTLAHHQTHHE